MSMHDSFGRDIHYLRVSVTDRCNLRCRYCRPADGVPLIRHTDVLSYEEIATFVRTAANEGITKVRITGGEPLVRRGVVDLVHMLAQIETIHDLAMTTNGTLLVRHAADLKKAGLHRVNVSLDTLDPDRFRYTTRGGNVNDVLDGIRAARDAGLTPIKLNCVVDESRWEPDAQAVEEFARESGCEARFIRRMNLSTGRFHVVEGGSGGDCARCNRLRLSSNGWLRPCLFSDIRFNIRDMPYEEALRRAVEAKPKAGTYSHSNVMSRIGG